VGAAREARSPFLSGMKIASVEYPRGQSSGGRRANFMILWHF
jgi:hypothetical protein